MLLAQLLPQLLPSCFFFILGDGLELRDVGVCRRGGLSPPVLLFALARCELGHFESSRAPDPRIRADTGKFLNCHCFFGKQKNSRKYAGGSFLRAIILWGISPPSTKDKLWRSSRFWQQSARRIHLGAMVESFNPNQLQEHLPFPATTKQAAGSVKGVKTDVLVMSFSDKIMVTVSQNGRLAHWVCLMGQFHD